MSYINWDWRIMPGDGISQIDKHIPFGSHIYWWLRCSRCQSFDTLVKRADQYERRYLAWEQIRKGDNPFFENGTGFEGYFVGLCASAEEALSQVLSVGHNILNNLSSLHCYDPRFKAKMLDTLVNEVPDFKAMQELSAEFGAEVAKLRCNALRNAQSEGFHTELYYTVAGLPHITYKQADQTVTQHYVIVTHPAQNPRLVVSPSQLTAHEQEAWLVVQTIGKFGHPLLREFMDLVA